jgi:hypothetical protein
MSHKTPNHTHNSEDIYKIPFVEHEYAMYRESKIRSRIVKALIVTNTIWLLFVAFIMSSKR